MKEENNSHIDPKKLAEHFERVINNLNQHWHSIQLLLSHVSKPLTVDDRGLAHVLKEFRNYMEEALQSMKDFNLVQVAGELKFIGKRITEIEECLEEIKEKGIIKNVQLDFRVDSYELVKKPKDYQPENIECSDDDKIKSILKTLLPREEKVVIHRIGLFGSVKKTYVSIGRLMNISAERVSQIYKKSLRKLRHPTRIDLVKACAHPELKREVLGS